MILSHSFTRFMWFLILLCAPSLSLSHLLGSVRTLFISVLLLYVDAPRGMWLAKTIGRGGAWPHLQVAFRSFVYFFVCFSGRLLLSIWYPTVCRSINSSLKDHDVQALKWEVD